MKAIQGTAIWRTVPQLENGDIIFGGEDRLANAQAKALADRSLFLKEEIQKAKENLSATPESKEKLFPAINNVTAGQYLINDGSNAFG